MITQKFILASMKLKQKYYVLNISYTNSKISIGRPYIQPTLQLTTQASPLLEPQPQFADIHIGPCHGLFVDILHVNQFGHCGFTYYHSTLLVPRNGFGRYL